MDTTLRVGGYALEFVGAVGDLTWSHRWGAGMGGCWEASWTMDLPPKYSHPALVSGQDVEILVGAECVWSGELSEPNRGTDGWSLAASGHGRHEWYAFDGALNTTAVPNTAVDQAIPRGAKWIRRASLSGSAFAAGDFVDGLTTVQALLAAWAEEQGKRVAVGADRVIYAAADPTEPTWLMIPGSAVPGVADDDFATNLYGRYMTTTAGYATATAEDPLAAARWGTVERAVDLTPMGPISGARATAVLDGMLANGASRLGWTEPLEPAAHELTTLGGTGPVDLRFVRAGQMIRAYGIDDDTRAAAVSVDQVIGESRYTDQSGVISLAPVDQAITDYESLVADLVRRTR